MASPKGGNRRLRVRIRGRCILNVSLTSHEKLVSYKMLCFQLNWSLSPSWRIRREETERCESESGVHVFLTCSWHLMKNLFLVKCYVFNRIRPYLGCGEPEGRKPSALYQNPGSMHFNVSWPLIKKVVLLEYSILVWIIAYLRCGEPRGGESGALYQNPGSIPF